MQFHAFKLRFRRRLRQRQHQVEDIGQQTEVLAERYFFQRLNKLNSSVWRFVIAWVSLFVLLIGSLVGQNLVLSGYYQHYVPAPGGIFTEGIVGSFNNANPLYASSEVDKTVSKLLFAGLLKYDDKQQLVGDLADKWSVDAKGTTYTVTLRPHLTWQDGQPLTADDVVYTYKALQNPDAQSPYESSWHGITVAKVNARTVTFTLPNVLASFPQNLMNGIVPAHLLAKVPMSDLRSIDFNTANPIGSGPFMWRKLQVSGTGLDQAEEQIALTPFSGYYAGEPKLKSFIVHVFATRHAMEDSYTHGQLTAMVNPSVDTPANAINYNLVLSAATMVFFKTSSGVLSDKVVRGALVKATDTDQIITKLGYGTKAVREPLLQGQLGYDKSYVQPGFDPAAAQTALDQAGWVMGKNGIRAKAGQALSFNLTASDTPEYAAVSRQLALQWRKIGVQANVQLEDPENFQSVLTNHSYDAVLYGITIGPDPDVFVYWDSSQGTVLAANRLNLSEYKSSAADAALESGRTRLDPVLRAVKYKPFLQAWQQDSPALGLYQPRLRIVANTKIYGLDEHQITNSTDALNNVQNWMIRTTRKTN